MNGLQQLFSLVEVKANHPITCINPEEWFTVTKWSLENDRIWICSDSTCWFSLDDCEIRLKSQTGRKCQEYPGCMKEKFCAFPHCELKCN